MSGLNELYQEVILDHNKRPRNFRTIEPASHHAEGHNPLCGDRLALYVQVTARDDRGRRVPGIRLRDLQGVGVADDRCDQGADASRLRTRCFERFHSMVTTPPDQPVEDMGKLSVLAGVREFPVRVKCASLCWHTLKAALDREPNDIDGIAT